MNDPQVVALIYTVEHGDSVSYKNAAPLRHYGWPEFYLTVDNKIARFEFKKFYADKDEALEAIEPFIQLWEFEAAVRRGPSSFRLRYKEAEIVDRNPSPPERTSGPIELGAEAVIKLDLSASAKITQVLPHYPPPPVSRMVYPDDGYVAIMKRRYDQYRLRRAKLPGVAYFCVTVLEDKYGGRPAAAKKCGISKDILDTIGRLSATKGGDDARKAAGADEEFTRQEKRFLKKAIEEIIIRAALVAFDDRQNHPRITMADLPSL